MAIKSKSRLSADLPNRIVLDKKTGKINELTAVNINAKDISTSGTIGASSASFSGNVNVTGSFGSVQDGAGNYSVIPGSFVTTIIHTGVGTVTVPTDGFIKGSQISIVSSGTMSINWGSGAKGVSIGNACKMASGTFDGGKWFFSESTAT